MTARSESYGRGDRYRPFSNGTEHMMWLETNCMRGERGCRSYRPNATSSRDGCPIECAVALASCDDGTIPVRIALRGGFLEPGPGGRLVESRSDAHPHAKVIPACPEYRGYDEPDDRPRRVPKPPADQLDLLDPRNVPDRERVA
jgi:hypothetical protein